MLKVEFYSSVKTSLPSELHSNDLTLFPDLYIEFHIFKLTPKGITRKIGKGGHPSDSSQNKLPLQARCKEKWIVL